MNGVDPYLYLRDLLTSNAHGHMAKDIDALMPWAYAEKPIITSFTMNNAHAIDIVMKHCCFARHGLQGFV